MGRRSKASQSRLSNLRNNFTQSHKATIEDASDSDEDFDWEPTMPELDDVSDSECEETELEAEAVGNAKRFVLDAVDCEFEDELQMEQEIMNDAALLTFSKALHDAQEAAVAEERKRSKSQRPKHYTWNSARSQCQHAQNRKTLAGTGQSSIAKWVESLKLKTPVREAHGEPNAEDLQGSSDESHTNPREEESKSGCSDSQTPSGQPNLPPNVPASGIAQEVKKSNPGALERLTE